MGGREIVEVGFGSGFFEDSVEITLDSSSGDVDYSFESDFLWFFVATVEGHYEIVVDE